MELTALKITKQLNCGCTGYWVDHGIISPEDSHRYNEALRRAAEKLGLKGKGGHASAVTYEVSKWSKERWEEEWQRVRRRGR